MSFVLTAEDSPPLETADPPLAGAALPPPWLAHPATKKASPAEASNNPKVRLMASSFTLGASPETKAHDGQSTTRVKAASKYTD